MDAALLNMMHSGPRNKNWGETMINQEARKLIKEANLLANYHLQDSLTRMNFVTEIKGVIEKQFSEARRAKTDKEYVTCIKNLRAETENLQEQDRMLQMKTANLYAEIKFIKENNKIVGYVINAVKIAVSGAAIIGGGIMITTMGPLGMLAGAILVADGFNGITKETANIRNIKSEGIVADAAMSTAKFMGFTPESGLGVYKSVSLLADAYGIFGLLKKPNSWRLFHNIPVDFYRRVNTLSRPKLTMKIIGYGVKAKVIFDLMAVNDTSQE